MRSTQAQQWDISSTIRNQPTIHSEIAQGSTGSPLDLGVMAREEEEDRVQGVPAHGADLFLGNLSEGESSTPLEVDVVREREGGEGSEG
jgi:hypothetical protein